MKHCARDTQEPNCLSDVRESPQTPNWEAFRNEQPACYREIRESLRASQRGLCAYCEIRIAPLARKPTNNEQIAHFHPKSDWSGGRNWAFEWDNLWLACKGGTRSTDREHESGSDWRRFGLPENRSCDEATENRILDGLILSPGEIPAAVRLFRYRQIRDGLLIEPDTEACEEAGIPIARVERTIDELNLNCRRLTEARLPRHRELEKAKRRVRESGRDPCALLRSLASRYLQPGADGYLESFFTVTRWSLGRCAEDCLRSVDFDI